MHRLIGLLVEKTRLCRLLRNEALFSFSERLVVSIAMQSRDVPTKCSATSKCTWPGFRRSHRDLERAWAMFLFAIAVANVQKMAIRILVSLTSRKRTETVTSSERHLSGIWLFNLRSFTMAHLSVSPKRCVIIWMQSNSGRNMTQFEQEWQPTGRITRVQLRRSCDASIRKEFGGPSRFYAHSSP